MKSIHAFKALACAFGCATLVLAQSGHSQSTQRPWTTLTPEKLSAVYFQWIVGLPAASSPWFDTNGATVTQGQPYFTAPGGTGQLLFLPGTLLGTVTLEVSAKQGTAYFAQVLMVEGDNTPLLPRQGGTVPVAGAALGVPQLRALIAPIMDTATGLYCTLTPADANFNATGDTVDLSYARVYSSPFAYTLPNDNVMNITHGRIAPAVLDAYWTFVPGDSLAPGHYLLQFGGQMLFGGGVFAQAITYHLTVIP
jgi:hypothetical protein